MSLIPLCEKGAKCLIKAMGKDSLVDHLMLTIENDVFTESGEGFIIPIPSTGQVGQREFPDDINEKIQILYQKFLNHKSALRIDLGVVDSAISGTHFYIPVEHNKFLYINAKNYYIEIAENTSFISFIKDNIFYAPYTNGDLLLCAAFSDYYFGENGNRINKLDDCVASIFKQILSN